MKHSILRTNKSKLIAAANDSFKLGEFGSEITMFFVQDRKTTSILQDLVTKDKKTPFRLSLRLERIKGNYAFPIIDIILNEENVNNKSKARTLGKLALYGLENSSFPSPGVEGGGLYERLDVTEAFIKAFERSDWPNNGEFSINLIPMNEIDDYAELTIDSVELWYEENFIEVGS